jgi:magnesium-transporting ATPase (P-type)
MDQLLWVNLIMDTLAALALATETPNPSLLRRKPHGRFDSLVNRRMWLNIVGQSILQVHLLPPLAVFDLVLKHFLRSALRFF